MVKKKIELPLEFLEMHFRRMSGGALKMYIYLILNDGELDYSKAREFFNVTDRTIRNWVEELKELELLEEEIHFEE